jgi:hypothetical protein
MYAGTTLRGLLQRTLFVLGSALNLSSHSSMTSHHQGLLSRPSDCLLLFALLHDVTPPKASVEDPSNGWVDARGTIHQIAHDGSLGLALHSVDGGISWHWNSTTAYNATLNWADGYAQTMASRQEPKVLLGGDGQPTHLISLCTNPSIAHSFVCVQPIKKG